jgi:hypothetical protein
MAGTPEVQKPVQPEPQETNREADFVVPETLQQRTGVQVVQKNFNAQATGNSGQPPSQTPPAQVVTIQPPADDSNLKSWSKGPVTSAKTWLGGFWIRIIKKAMYLGWRILRREKQNAA